MYSPGGPGNSSVMWGMGNTSAAERTWSNTQWHESPLALVPGIGLAAVAAVSPIGQAAIGRTLYYGSRPWLWAAYNAHKEAADIQHAMSGGKFEIATSMTYRPLSWKGFMHRPLAIAIPFPWFDFQGLHVEGSSSQDLVQNGGPLTQLHVTPDPVAPTRPARSSSYLTRRRKRRY